VKYRVIFKKIPEVGPARLIRQAMCTALGLSEADVDQRMSGRTPWLVDVPDRGAAEMVVELLNGSYGVSAASVPTVSGPDEGAGRVAGALRNHAPVEPSGRPSTGDLPSRPAFRPRERRPSGRVRSRAPEAELPPLATDAPQPQLAPLGTPPPRVGDAAPAATEDLAPPPRVVRTPIPTPGQDRKATPAPGAGGGPGPRFVQVGGGGAAAPNRLTAEEVRAAAAGLREDLEFQASGESIEFDAAALDAAPTPGPPPPDDLLAVPSHAVAPEELPDRSDEIMAVGDDEVPAKRTGPAIAWGKGAEADEVALELDMDAVRRPSQAPRVHGAPEGQLEVGAIRGGRSTGGLELDVPRRPSRSREGGQRRPGEGQSRELIRPNTKVAGTSSNLWFSRAVGLGMAGAIIWYLFLR
jgi:hypothetical protein